MNSKQQAAAAIQSMTYRELRDLATTMAATLDRDVQLIADTLVDWAESVDTKVYRSAEPAPAREPIGELQEDGSIKRVSEGSPDPEIPGGIVEAKQGGPARGDLPKAKPVEGEAIETDDGYVLLGDGSVTTRK